jgi:phenylacetate-CoA ligase
VADQADWLSRCNPAYLLTHPSNALALADACERRGIALPGLREVRTLGEVCEPAVRDACRRSWGVPVTDIYTTQEAGYLALQCPGQEHYHVQSETARVEILDGEGRPCRPGEVGRVVVTPLHSFAMPLLRYEVGDFAEVGEPCPCGRGLAVIRRILGRSRNLLQLPDGRRMWPSLGLARMRGIAPVRQIQVVQRTPDRLEARLAADRALTKAEEEALGRFLCASVGHDFEIVLRYFDEIPRGASGKYEDFLSELEGGGKGDGIGGGGK